jgi:truncated hemoglobin YjbI
MLRIVRYGNSRFWALYDGQDLVVVTVYKRGAREVQRRLAAQPPAATEAAAQAAAVEAAARQVQELAEHARALAQQAQAAAQAVRARAQPSG